MNHTHRSTEQGQAIVLLALIMAALLVFAALAIDGGNTYVERRRAQNAADAAALAGARALWLHFSAGDSSETGIRVDMNQAAESNGIADTNQYLGDFYNTNVIAYYTNKAGDQQNIEVGATGSIPSNVAGVQVTTQREFNTFLAGLIGRDQMGATAMATAVIIPPISCGDYAIYATGSDHSPSLKVTGSNSGGDNMQIVDGGLYSGNGGQFQNTGVYGNPTPPVDIVGGCNGTCDIPGAPVNYLGEPLTPPALYEITDYEPGGQYARVSGWTSGCSAPNGCGNYHYYGDSLDLSETTLNGLYYVEGDVDLHNVTGNASIVATGNIRMNGGVSLSTYDPRFPLFFTLSGDTSSGAVAAHNPALELHGFIYAPNGSVNISGAEGALFGAIYAKEVTWDASKANIYYEPAFCPPTRARVILLK